MWWRKHGAQATVIQVEQQPLTTQTALRDTHHHTHSRKHRSQKKHVDRALRIRFFSPRWEAFPNWLWCVTQDLDVLNLYCSAGYIQYMGLKGVDIIHTVSLSHKYEQSCIVLDRSVRIHLATVSSLYHKDINRPTLHLSEPSIILIYHLFTF